MQTDMIEMVSFKRKLLKNLLTSVRGREGHQSCVRTEQKCYVHMVTNKAESNKL